MPTWQPSGDGYVDIDLLGLLVCCCGCCCCIFAHLNHHHAFMTTQDVISTRPGDALLDAQIIDYDLMTKVRDEMNKYKAFRAYHDARFDLEEVTTSHVLSESEAPTASEALKCLRADVRYFKWRNGVVGHTSIIWNRGERPCDLSDYRNARELLDATEMDEPLPPSLLYALAALLEGCSFVNAPVYLMECPGLLDVVRQQLGVYCVGSDFRRSFAQQGMMDSMVLMGLSDIRQDDPNEITASAFLGQPHSLVTYSKTHASILSVPLMIDAVVLCDFFASRSWPHDKVATALAYLFESPRTTGTLASQIQELKAQTLTASKKSSHAIDTPSTKKRVRIRPEEKATEWAIPQNASIICAGLACVDMQLHQATGGDGGETIETFQGETSIGGGSVSMACKTLARLCHGLALDDGYMQVTPPVVHSVIPLCKIGNDDTGNKLVSLLEKCGTACRNVDTKLIREARRQDSTARTALAVLPIFKDGRRGCYFDAASNDTFSSEEMMDMIGKLTITNGLALDKSQLSTDEMEIYHNRVDGATPVYGAFLFGYPHLLPMLQGQALANVFMEARSVMIDGGIVVMDLNGVPEGTFQRSESLRTVSDLEKDRVIGAALEHVDILHMNEEELQMLTGCNIEGTPSSVPQDEFNISSAIELFLHCGVGIVVVTRGQRGSFVSCNDEGRFAKSEMLPHAWIDCTAKINAVELPRSTVINTNGAGDSFTAGFLVATMLRHTGLTIPGTPQILNTSTSSSVLNLTNESIEMREGVHRSPSKSPVKSLTPYQLYMRENYVSLKKQCNDDKRAIFTKCHEMWENESDDVKLLYDRKALEENEAAEENDLSMRLQNDMEAMDRSSPRSSPQADAIDDNNRYMVNRALTLESAVQFASLVAAHHVDTSTRNLTHIDVTSLLERSMIFPDGLEEI